MARPFFVSLLQTLTSTAGRRTALILTLLCIAAVMLWCWNPGLIFRNQVNWTIEDVERLLASSIPKQASSIEVEAFVKQQHFRRTSRYVDPATPLEDDAAEAA